MLERPRRLAATVIVGGMLVAACGAPATPAPSETSSPAPSASPTPPGSPSTSPSPSAAASPTDPTADLQALTDQISSEVQALRGLDAKQPISVSVLDEAALVEHLKKSFTDQYPPELIAATDSLYVRLGLLAPTASLEDLQLELLGSQVLGFYDDDDKTLYVVARGPNEQIGPLERFTMSHEIDHALQDQHFDLKKLIPEVTDQSDATLAGQSLAEGDATVLMTQWALGHLTAGEVAQVLAAANDPEQQAILAKMPRILKDTLEFPYTQGATFVTGAMRGGGWPGVDALYGEPPASTEQVIHADKYAAHEAPVKVDIPSDVLTRLGSGWKIAVQDTMGEFQTALWLSDAGKRPQATADAAAAGWGGDRIAYLDGPGDADGVIWKTTWDSPAEADQFAAAAEASRAALPYPTTVVHASGSPDVTILIGSDDKTLVTLDGAAGLTGV